MKLFRVILPLVLVSVLSACAESSAPASPSPSSLTKPSLDSPAEAAQLDNIRPTLTLVNSSAGGTKTYEFEISDSSATGAGNAFTTRTFASPAVPEAAGGKTNVTVSQDLELSTRYYWHARAVQGTSTSDWSETRSFNTKIGGFNRPGALFDPLVNGETIGTIGGNITWRPGVGIQMNDALSYVYYQLPQVLLTGELSVEATGLGPGGPCCKVRVFSIIDSVGTLASSSPYSMNGQYRGVGGNPDNCICFKSVFGNNADGLEPTTAQRLNMSYVLDPSKVYLWRAVWTRSSYRLIVRENGTTGTPIYDFTAQSTSANWNPSRMFAFLGTDNGKFDPLDGTLRGMTLRNLWVGSTSRPDSLGTATASAH